MAGKKARERGGEEAHLRVNFTVECELKVVGQMGGVGRRGFGEDMR